MVRPKKSRKICSLPETLSFGPVGCRCHTAATVMMTLDEYETIRLIDYIGLTQEECALVMNVARTTVTGIYDAARKKLADTVVNGRRLSIEGGEVILCRHRHAGCGRDTPHGTCPKPCLLKRKES